MGLGPLASPKLPREHRYPPVLRKIDRQNHSVILGQARLFSFSPFKSPPPCFIG